MCRLKPLPPTHLRVGLRVLHKRHRIKHGVRRCIQHALLQQFSGGVRRKACAARFQRGLVVSLMLSGSRLHSTGRACSVRHGDDMMVAGGEPVTGPPMRCAAASSASTPSGPKGRKRRRRDTLPAAPLGPLRGHTRQWQGVQRGTWETRWHGLCRLHTTQLSSHATASGSHPSSQRG